MSSSVTTGRSALGSLSGSGNGSLTSIPFITLELLYTKSLPLYVTEKRLGFPTTPPVDEEKSTTARDAARQYAPNRAFAGARRKARARSAVPPSVVFEHATANSKGGSGRRALSGRSLQETRALASLDFATHANQRER